MHVCVVTVLKHKDCLIQQYPQGSTDFLLPLMLPVRGKKDQAFPHVSNAPQPECKFLVLVEFLNSFSNTFNKLVLIGLGPLSPSSQSWRRTHEQTRQWLEASGVVSTSQNCEHEYFPLVLMQLWMLVTCFWSAWVRNRCCGTASAFCISPRVQSRPRDNKETIWALRSLWYLTMSSFLSLWCPVHPGWHKPGCWVIFGREVRACEQQAALTNAPALEMVLLMPFSSCHDPAAFGPKVTSVQRKGVAFLYDSSPNAGI